MEKRDKKSAIITIGSVNGEMIRPFNLDYGNSKCFENNFTLQLQSDKIDSLLLTPGLMPTSESMTSGHKMDHYAVDPNQVV